MASLLGTEDYRPAALAEELGPAAQHRVGLLGMQPIECGLHGTRDLVVAGPDHVLIIGGVRPEGAPVERCHELDSDLGRHGQRWHKGRGDAQRPEEDREHLDPQACQPEGTCEGLPPGEHHDGGVAAVSHHGDDWDAGTQGQTHEPHVAGEYDLVALSPWPTRLGVPVVPVVAYGSHHAVVVLSRGETLARALGLTRLRIKVFPILLGPLGVTSALMPPLPMPAEVTVEFMAPLDWSAFGPDAAKDEDVVRACYDEITGAMQATLDGV